MWNGHIIPIIVTEALAAPFQFQCMLPFRWEYFVFHCSREL